MKTGDRRYGSRAKSARLTEGTRKTDMLASIIRQAVAACVRHATLIALSCLALAIAATAFTATHFRMNTDTTRMVSPDLDWRKRQAAFQELFPQPANQILIVVDGVTPEAAQSATDRLVEALAKRPDLILSTRQPGGGPFFRQNGLLFLETAQTESAVSQIIAAQPFSPGALAADACLRGIKERSLHGSRGCRARRDHARPPVAPVHRTRTHTRRAQGRQAGAPPRRPRMSDGYGAGSAKRHWIKPCSRPGLELRLKILSAFIRTTASNLGLTPENGVTIRLTGPVPIFDEEFGTLTENAALIGGATTGFMLLMLWLALRSARLIAAIIATILAGLVITTALGLAMLGAFNIISVAFVALFVVRCRLRHPVCVRYRAERHATPDLATAISNAAHTIGPSLTLAACAITAGFPDLAHGLSWRRRTRAHRRHRHDHHVYPEPHAPAGADRAAKARRRGRGSRLCLARTAERSTADPRPQPGRR